VYHGSVEWSPLTFFRSNASPYYIFSGEIGSGAGFYPSTSLFTCDYHFTNPTSSCVLFNLVLLLSEGQAGQFWESSNKAVLFSHGGALEKAVLLYCLLS